MLTSSREESDLVRSYKLGVNAYVVKPVDFTEFMDAVKQLGVFWAVVNEVPPVGEPQVTAMTLRIVHLEDDPLDRELVARRAARRRHRSARSSRSRRARRSRTRWPIRPT